ncbi:uncharacterized protein LODBEIA_P16710 [Lodderomyces beijingensis]|uniref:Response regulatory domain-containing protein n=1 Tax=Lodderomyces beijingensis TaxID=1775926 RepID=A0ABP0ZJ32_9ASCO
MTFMKPTVKSPISLPSTPSRAYTTSASPLKPDYFSLRPKLSLDISRTGSDYYGSEESELEDVESHHRHHHHHHHGNDSDNEDLSGISDTFDNVSIVVAPRRGEEEYYTPMTPFEIPESNLKPATIASPKSLSASSSPIGSPFTNVSSTPASFQLQMPNLNQYKFLIVDDNIINLKILNRILLKIYPRAQITQVVDSSKVEKLVLENTFDCIFLDIEMPVVNGVEIAQFVRSDLTRDDIALIAVTTRTSSSDVECFASNGIDHTLGKPLNYKLDYLGTLIGSVMSSRKIKKSVGAGAGASTSASASARSTTPTNTTNTSTSTTNDDSSSGLSSSATLLSV